MLYREIMAVCSEIHTKHINTLCGQNVELVNVKPLVHVLHTIRIQIYNKFLSQIMMQETANTTKSFGYTRVGTLIVATIYLQLIQNGYMFRSFTVLQCSHQHCVQPVASDVEVLGYL